MNVSVLGFICKKVSPCVIDDRIVVDALSAKNKLAVLAALEAVDDDEIELPKNFVSVPACLCDFSRLLNFNESDSIQDCELQSITDIHHHYLR